MPQTPEEESLGSLVAQATDHISTLVRSEIELAKSELRFNAGKVGGGAGLIAAAAFLLHLCLILLLFGCVYVLAQWLPTWAAFFVVMVFFLIVAGALIFFGIRQLKKARGMTRTVRSIKGLKEIATPDDDTDAASERPQPVSRPVTRDGT
jgi:hypothetical protein